MPIKKHKAVIVMQTCLQLNCNLELASRIELGGGNLGADGFPSGFPLGLLWILWVSLQGLLCLLSCSRLPSVFVLPFSDWSVGIYNAFLWPNGLRMKPRIFWYSQTLLGEWYSEGFARRRFCSPSEQASLGHFLDFSICVLGLCSFKINALKKKLECLKNAL